MSWHDPIDDLRDDLNAPDPDYLVGGWDGYVEYSGDPLMDGADYSWRVGVDNECWETGR